MDYLNNILNQNNQKVQLVDEAIPTLCNRLQHATLSSDRRSAILGLKSFSRQYRETVVEYGLRPLISSLKKDWDNSAVIRPLLECILILLIRGESDEDMSRGWISQQLRIQNGKYPSPLLLEEISYDQFSLWISDELTKDEQTIQTLLDIISNETDYHSRLYTIQLLESLVSTRSVRVKECLLNIPTGISTVVTLLSDSNDPIRNEAILLLMAIANNNFNIQKLVAFENTFDTLFDIIDEEGGIRGSILVQDCLTLILNLLMYNASNQKFFLETQGAIKLAKLLEEPLVVDQPEIEGELPNPPMVWTEQRILNMMIALDISRTFVTEDSENLKVNQDKLNNSEILNIVLRLIFAPETINDIRMVALLTAADLIRGNNDIQLMFANIDIPYIDPTLPTQIQSHNKPIPITLALLNWVLYINSVHCFNLRTSAAYCLRAYFSGNEEAKVAFIEDQVNAYKANGKEEPLENGDAHENGTNGQLHTPPPDSLESMGNIFSTLMDYDSESNLNPYRTWFAAVILLYLFEDNDSCKGIAKELKTGDESNGEEVLGSIEAMAGLLVTTLENSDPRISIGYMMLLTCWMYEDPLIVNEFLRDTSVIHSILTFLTNNSTEGSEVTRGMATVLLGVAYDFSTKDSPLSRVDLHALLVKSFGKDNYSLKVKQFKECNAFKFFDEEAFLFAQKDESGLPDLLFDSIYVNLVKDNFSRIRRALFHDPNFEPQIKISYDEFEELDTRFKSLYNEYEESKKNFEETDAKLKLQIEELEATRSELETKLENSTTEHESLKEKNSKTLSELDSVNKSLSALQAAKNGLEKTSAELTKDLEAAKKKVTSTDDSVKNLEQKLSVTEEARKKAEDGINKMSRELFHLSKDKKDSENNLKALQKEIDQLKKEYEKSSKKDQNKISTLQTENKDLQGQISQLKSELTSSRSSTDTEMNLLKDKILEAEANNEHLMDKLRAAAAAFQEMKTAKVENDGQLGDLKKSIALKESELNETVKKLEKVESDFEALMKELSDLKNSSASKEEETSNSLKKLQELNAQLESKYKDSLSNSSSLEEKLAQVTEQLSSVKQDLGNQVDELKKENQELLDQISALKSEHKKALEGSSSFKEEIEDLKKKHLESKASYDRAIESHSVELEDIKNSHLKELNGLKSNSESQLADSSKEIEKLREEIKELNTTLTTEKENLTKLKADLSLAEKSKLENDSLVSELRQEIESRTSKQKLLDSEKDEKIGSLESELKTLNDSLQDSKTKFQKKAEEHEAQEKNMNKLRQDVKTKQSRLGELETKILEAGKQSVDLEDQLAKSKSILQKNLDTNKAVTQELKELKDTQNQERNNFQASLKRSEDTIETLKKDLDSKTKEVEKERDMLNQSSDAVVKEYTDKIKKLEREISDLKTDHYAKMKSVDLEKEGLSREIANHKKQISSLEHDSEEGSKKNQEALAQKEASIVELQKKLDLVSDSLADKEKELLFKEKQLESTKTDFTAKENLLKTKEEDFTKISKDLEDLKLKYDSVSKTLEAKEESIEKLSEDLAHTKKTLEDSRSEVNQLQGTSEDYKALQQEIEKSEATKNTLEQEVVDVKNKLKDLDELKKNLEQAESEKLALQKSLEKSDNHSSKKIEELKSKHQKELKDKENEVKEISSGSESLKIQLEDLQKKHEDAQQKLSETSNAAKQVTDLNDSVKQLQKDADVKTQQIKQLEEENLSTKQSLEAASVKEADLIKEVESLKSQLKASKADTVPKSELDDLMLILSELEESKDKYKTQLKELGKEVSEDEEDDDDDDDDEDDEDD